MPEPCMGGLYRTDPSYLATNRRATGQRGIASSDHQAAVGPREEAFPATHHPTPLHHSRPGSPQNPPLLMLQYHNNYTLLPPKTRSPPANPSLTPAP